MSRHTRSLLSALLLGCALIAPSAAAQTRQRAAVVVAELVGVDESTATAARALTEQALHRHGIDVMTSPRLPLISPASAQRTAFLAQHGVGRLIELKLVRLGHSLTVVVSERDGADRVVHRDALAAARSDELDLVLARLVEAVLRRQPVEAGATVDTTTHREGRPWQKRGGEFLWGLGLVFGTPFSKAAATPSYGAELRFAYEMPHARLGVDLGTSGASGSITQFKLALHGSYLFSTGDFSPFVGGGVALLGQDADEDFEDSDDPQGSAAGVAALLNGGVEFFRLHRVRLLGEAELMLPTFRHPSQWLPTGLLKLSLLW